jgi:splicing factor 45
VADGTVGTAVAMAPGTSSPDKQFPGSTPQQPPVGRGLTYEDVVNNVDEDEDEELYMNRKPKWQGRGGKKHKKHKNRTIEEEDDVDWDAIYDPAKPSNLARYQGSTEQDAERDEWIRFLRWHRDTASKHVEAQNPKLRNSTSAHIRERTINNSFLDMFAPPAGLNFAPPVINNALPVGNDPMDTDDDEYYPPPASDFPLHFDNDATHHFSAPSVAPADLIGHGAYKQSPPLGDVAQQAVLQGSPEATSQQPQQFAPRSSIPAPPVSVTPPTNFAAQMEAAKAKLAAAKAKIDAQHANSSKPAASSPTPPAELADVSQHPSPMPPQNTSTIFKAPVLYNLPEAQIDALADRQLEHARPESASGLQPPVPAQPKSKVSGQRDFAARMMAKMGYKDGQGLGARGDGITTAIVAQPTKRKRRSDKDGGGWMPSVGKIVGGKKRKVESTDDDEGEFGNISNIVKLQGMLDELDVTYEIEENNLLQEIGEQFSKDYGAIERLFIWREQNGGSNEVFVKFTNQFSALKACGGTNEMTFAGNPVKARFFDAAKFENGEYA